MRASERLLERARACKKYVIHRAARRGKSFARAQNAQEKRPKLRPYIIPKLKTCALLEKAAQQQLLQLIIRGRARSDILSLHQPECNSKVNLLKPSKKKRQLGFSVTHKRAADGCASPLLLFNTSQLCVKIS